MTLSCKRPIEPSELLHTIINFRVSNHPDFVGIILIFLENPETRHNLGRDRKNPDFEDLLHEQRAQKYIFVKFS